VDELVAEKKEIDPVWKDGFAEVLDSYLGELPSEFEYQGSTYTSKSFAEELGFDPDDYIMVTSFIHEPYYHPVILEIPDNWSWAPSYNVPLDILEEIVDSALLKGYSVAWATDISEEGFNFSKGMAVAPKVIYSDSSKSDARKWKKKSGNEKEQCMFSLTEPVEEIEVTPELRQKAFDNYTTTDDHGMHILGLARDRNGRIFYYVKNSWGADNPYEGYLFVSKPYFKFKTISIMVNREAIAPEIIEKLSIK
jgi:bleomycin hydrolase